MAAAGDITALLTALRRGDQGAQSQLIALIYEDLHERAEQYMRKERPDHTLQPTALVNETYLRMVRDDSLDFESRAHFFATASIVMRRVLVDHARQRSAGKRPSGKQRVELDDWLAAQCIPIDRMLILEEALQQLAEWDARQARIVEMMYFAGLTEVQVAEVLGISARTVKRDWQSARSWLQAQLSRPCK